MSPLGRVQAALEAAGSRRQGAMSWTCPAHDDQRASLSVQEGRDGRVVLRCHAACETRDVIAALGLDWSDLFPERPSSRAKPVDHYRYVDESGRLLFECVRYWPKDFRQRRPDGNGGWAWSLADTRRVLYRLPAVLQAVAAGRPVWVAEGERDVHALEAAGVAATCNPMGAGKWREEYASTLADATVTVVADRDQAGYAHARTVAASLQRAGCNVRVVEAAKGKDAADHLAAGLGLGDFLPVDLDPSDAPQSAISATSAESGSPAGVNALPALLAQPPEEAAARPALDPAAFHGLAGKLVDTLRPHTEADDAALLLTFLAAFGNAVGPGPRALVGPRSIPPASTSCWLAKPPGPARAPPRPRSTRCSRWPTPAGSSSGSWAVSLPARD
jgi:hypothetical protein